MDLPILIYHHLEPDGARLTHCAHSIGRFTAHLDGLKNAGFKTLSFCALFDILERGGRVPGKSVLVTFDDGYESFRQLALPALVKRGMTATVFVVANEMGGFNRWDAGSDIPRRELMNDSGLKEILSAGMEVGVHGWNHRNLPRCTQSELGEEIVTAKAHLEQRLGIRTDVFAYPYGYYSKRLFPLLKQTGYRGAVSVFSDEQTVTSEPFAMRRVPLYEHDNAWRFRFKISKLYSRYMAWRYRTGGVEDEGLHQRE